jgi:hypothetical protein
VSASLRISANTSEVKKSLLDLSRDVKSLGKTKISIFSESDRKFVKEELNKELSVMKTKLVENRTEIGKMVVEQTKLEKGSKEELEHRKKIIDAYRTQTKLASQANQIEKQSKSMGGFGGIGGASATSGLPGMLAKVGSLLGGAAVAIGALALMKGMQASSQFAEGAGNRVRLRGLGMQSMNVGSPRELAEAGMTEQDFIRRQTSAVSRLGRAGGSTQSIMQQAKFERSFGLEEGSMMNVSGALRGQMGGKGADQAQMKLQASVFASGIEEAIGPYLESATELLSEINKNGLTNTDEMINVMSQLVKDGKQTPEQIAESFKSLDSAVKNASGESNAFLQTAFARGGIGGGKIGATRLAMSSGGVFGLNEDELAKRGYNPDLIQNMKGAGFTQGLQNRSGSILNQFKQSAGMGKGQKIGDVTDLNTMVGLSQMSNSVLGTQGMEGFDTLRMMEQVQNKQMTQKQFDQKVKDMREGKDPQIERLNKINASLEGQTEILRTINTNLMENLGKTAVKAGNVVVDADNVLTGGIGEVAKAVDNPDTQISAMKGIKKLNRSFLKSRVGEDPGGDFDEFMQDQEDQKMLKQGNMPTSETDKAVPSTNNPEDLAKAVETGMTKALQAQKTPVIQNNNKTNVRVQSSDGYVSDKTHK